MAEKNAYRPSVDWDAMEPDWRAGVISVKALSEQYGVSRAAILKHWGKAGVERDLSAKIHAKADSLVTQQAVTPEVTQERRVTEKRIIDANATMLADKVLGQRTDVARARATVQRLWAIVDAELDSPEELEQLGKMMRSPDAFGQDRLNDMYLAAVAIPQQVKNVKLLCDSLKTLIELERKVLKLDTLAEMDEDAAKKAGEDAGRAVAAGVDAAMSALAEKLNAHRA